MTDCKRDFVLSVAIRCPKHGFTEVIRPGCDGVGYVPKENCPWCRLEELEGRLEESRKVFSELYKEIGCIDRKDGSGCLSCTLISLLRGKEQEG